MKLRSLWNLLKDIFTTHQDFTTRIDAAEALSYASVRMKQLYDSKHTKPPVYEKDQYAFLRLHKGYTMPLTKLLGKYAHHYAGPFRIAEVKAGGLACKLDLPSHWRIHPVQPEPASADPFARQPNHPAEVADDEWEAERIPDKRIVKRGRSLTELVEYLIRWLGYGAEHDQWIRADEMTADELVEEFEKSLE
ncbi:chromo domain-containing protein [Aspergillus affinis]|uniref:chromo domain-containing protein n=1 Tax=Aspergillus affinis TaxID=1070780 RepID=UPI0022FE53EB|nr:uncharacterized protein KD926_002148 [Aspergillus affinis]KAI9036239.1 hypothetical protein KD926_002148 [Aspergillus affinis]